MSLRSLQSPTEFARQGWMCAKRLRWKRTRGSHVYHVYMTDDVTAPLTWKLVGTVTTTRFVQPGLDTGKRYWFKVEAIGSAGAGAASDPATMIAA